MQPENKYIITKNWFVKAEESLEEANISIKNNLLNSAQNRIYYAVFYSVMALGYSKDFITSKHSQLLGWFNYNFIKEKIFDKKLGETYKTAYENRTKCDYTYTYKPDKEKISNLFSDAQIFVQTIKTYIENN